MIIGISGKAFAGKDTFGAVASGNFGFTRVGFADPLKELAMKYFGLTYDECYVNKTEHSRCILQGLGNAMREEVSMNFWVDRLYRDNIEGKEKTDFVITDVRYKNEVEAIESWGGRVIRVNRIGGPVIETGADHISEIDLDDHVFDYELTNTDLQLFKVGVKSMLREFTNTPLVNAIG